MTSMIRVAIIGCGKIADQHVLAIRRIPSSRVVAVCDREPLMADQLAERFGIEGRYSDHRRLLDSVAPDVVHITTPPQSHHALALECLEAGSHVYIEKPFTETAAEATSLVTAAQRHGRLITAGHNYQFSFEMLRMRQLVAEGYLGGRPVHVESHWSYDLGDSSYVGPLLGSPSHWVRRLPGGLLHNLVSHGIARLAEFLDDGPVEVMARAHQSPQLQRLGGARDVLDELRVLMRDARGTTATFCFSTQIRPGQNRLHIHGPANSITVDLAAGSVIRHQGRSHKSFLTYLVPPIVTGREHLSNAWRNLIGILRKQVYQDYGMKELIDRFHACISSGGSPPIPYREILLTATIMDEIFRQLRDAEGGALADAEPLNELAEA